MQKQLVCVLAFFAAVAAAQAQQPLSQQSLVAPETVAANVYNGHQWWDIRQEEIPSMQNMAALFANGLKSSPGAFAGMFTELVALGYQVQAARSFAYLINANLTLSGGCPNPPPLASFTDQVGDAITRAVSLGRTPVGARLALPNNLTEAQVADALLAGIALAAKSCGPPNSLSSSGQDQSRMKYRNSTCYYVGPILATPLSKSAVFADRLAAAATSLYAQDPYGIGAVLAGMQDCAAAGDNLQMVPTWLKKSYGAVDQQELTNTVAAWPLPAQPPAKQPSSLQQQQAVLPSASVGGRKLLQA